MDWDKLKAFYHVAKLKHMGKASEKLYRSQSAISRQILQLEDRLGKPLFIRTKRGLILTEAGAILYKTAEQVFDATEKAKAQIIELSEEPAGEIKVATITSLASAWLPRYIPDFLNKYPHVTVTIIGSDQDLDLRSREADVAIRMHLADQPNLIQEYLTSFHLGLYASQEYLDKFGSPKIINDLDHHRLLSFGNYQVESYGSVNWHLDITSTPQKISPYLSVNSSQGLHLMAENGMGIASLSHEYARRNTKLIRILPNVDGPTIKIYYTYPSRLTNIKRIKTLGEFLKNRLHEEKLNNE
jgi:DNA-binding transcriptional LysR family regulator